MNFAVVIPLLAVFAGLLFLKPRLGVWIVYWWIGLYVFFRFGFETPIPSSAVQIYMAITALSLIAYVASSRERADEVVGPVVGFLTNRRLTPLVVAVALVPPALVAWSVWSSANQPVAAPFFARTIHPSPPAQVTVGEATIDVIQGENPLRELEDSDPEAFASHVANGRAIYYQNCFFCHGDGLGGDGPFAPALNPIPTSFIDANVLPNFRESFFFWRIAKGGPGMPDEGEPWASAMPEWERFLTPEEIWEVLLFLYDFTGYRPRAKEEFH